MSKPRDKSSYQINGHEAIFRLLRASRIVSPSERVVAVKWPFWTLTRQPQTRPLEVVRITRLC
jgi:hypothetical protein